MRISPKLNVSEKNELRTYIDKAKTFVRNKNYASLEREDQEKIKESALTFLRNHIYSQFTSRKITLFLSMITFGTYCLILDKVAMTKANKIWEDLIAPHYNEDDTDIDQNELETTFANYN